MVDKRILREKVSIEKRHWLRLTRTCNNHCVFCLDKESQDGSCIPLEEIKKDLIKGRKEKARRVVLSGGEPTLHPQFLGIIKLAKSLGYQHIQVITNGRMFAYRDFLELTVNTGINEVTFSIHGHNARLHDKQTQAKGSFHQSLTGLKNALKMPNLIVNVDVVINKFNVRYLSDILNFLIDLGVLEFDLLQVIPFGRAWDNRDKVIYNIDESLIYLKRAFQLSKNPNLYIWTNRFPPKYLEGFEELIQHPFKLYDEIKGRKVMFEQYLNNGRAISCRGERCQYCFLENFCQDLVEFKIKRELVVRNFPFCLNGNKESNDYKEISEKPYFYTNSHKSSPFAKALGHSPTKPKERRRTKAEFPRIYSCSFDKNSCKFVQERLFHGSHKIVLFKNSQVNIFKFLDFYINHRYFVKGTSCDTCKFDRDCQGMHINYIRHNGFELLRPIK